MNRNGHPLIAELLHPSTAEKYNLIKLLKQTIQECAEVLGFIVTCFFAYMLHLLFIIIHNFYPHMSSPEFMTSGLNIRVLC